MSKDVPTNTGAYVNRFPKEVRRLLKKLRMTIKKAAPKAKEKISYGMPTFILNGNLVYFAGYKKHIGFYPGSAAIRAFKKQLSLYKSGRGSVQFPLDEPLPLGLVTRIVKFRVQQALNKKK